MSERMRRSPGEAFGSEIPAAFESLDDLFLIGLLVVAGFALGGGAILLFGLIGAGLNGLLAASAGAAFPNSRLREFEAAIEAGDVLVMVNVPKNELEATETLIRQRHPELEIERIEPHTPVIPKG